MTKGPLWVFGASGGIGAALAEEGERQGYGPILRFSRAAGDFDFDAPDSITALGQRLRALEPPSTVIIATGVLHEGQTGPEKSWRALEADWMARTLLINTIGPGLLAREVIPCLPRSVCATLAFLSARVGSITDNRLGGWYSYRASKAALNMIVKTLAIELGRTHPRAVCVALHPGTVDSGLSKPFQGNVAESRLFDANRSARALHDVLDGLEPAFSGGCYAWDGKRIDP